MILAPRYRALNAETLVLGGGLVLGALVLCVLMSFPSMVLLALALAAMGFGGLAMLTRQVRKPLLALLFIAAPIEINKAVVASAVSLFYPGGPYYSPGLYLSLAHMALLLLALAWLGRRFILERRLPPMTRLDWMVLAYMSSVWLRSMGSPQGILSIATAASYSLAMLAFYVASHAIKDASDLRLVLRSSLFVLFLTIGLATLQYFTKSQLLQLPGIKNLAAGATIDLGNIGEVFRPPGFLSHPNALAHYLVAVLPPAVALVLVGPRRLSGKIWWTSALAAVSAGAALLVTLSRGGWLSGGLAVAVIVAVYYRRGLISSRQLRWLLAAVVVGAIAVLIAYPSILLRLTAPDGRSLESRVLLADMATTMIQHNPWIGVGFGDYQRAAYAYVPPLFATVSPDYHFSLHQLVVHNHYLLLAAELGVPAVLFFVYLLWRFARLAWPLERWRDPQTFALAVGLGAAVVGQGVFFNSDNYYADTRVFIFWLSAGLLQALTLHAERERSA